MGTSQSFNQNGNSYGAESAFTATGRKKKSIILQRQNEFPDRIQKAIREASKRKSSKNPKIFLKQVQDALADWLFEAAIAQPLHNNENSDDDQHRHHHHQECRGLNDERDTPEQVELALRFFPEVLCLRRYGLFPIMWLSKSLKSVTFIPLFARLGVELGLFQEAERGGLVFGSHGLDVFSQLAASCAEDGAAGKVRRGDKAYQTRVDATFLKVIEELRLWNLMTKSDIRKYKMVDLLVKQTVFPEQRFRYLIDWDPSALLSNNGSSKSKIVSIRLISKFFDKKDIGRLEMLFELSMKYYPVELGFLFDTMYCVDEEKKQCSVRKKKRGSFQKKKKHSTRRLANNDDMNRSDHTATTTSTYSGSNHSRTSTAAPLFEQSTSLFLFACEVYGKRVVEELIDSMLYAQMKKDPGFIGKALVRAAEQPSSEDAAETMYLLLQKDPTVLLRSPIRA